MKTKILFLLLFLLINNVYSEWRSYDIYRCGAKGLATGAAFTAISDDVSAIYWNPAGLVQAKDYSIFYTMDSQFKFVIDPKLKLTYKVPALLGFIYPLKNNYHTVIGFAALSPFQRKIPKEFAVYKFAPQFACEILHKLSIGINIGLNYATYTHATSASGYGVGYQIGLLYAPFQKVHFGLNYHSKIKINWGRHGMISDLKETFPDILTGGIAIMLTRRLIGSVDIEYQNWHAIQFFENGTDTAPIDDLKTGLCKTIHPHFGLMFLEKKTGAHLRTGLYTDSFIEKGDDSKFSNKTQLIWTIGIGAYALKILRIEVGVADSYLTHFLNKANNQIETVQITAEYRF